MEYRCDSRVTLFAFARPPAARQDRGRAFLEILALYCSVQFGFKGQVSGVNDSGECSVLMFVLLVYCSFQYVVATLVVKFPNGWVG
jgi:hypothetical protein